MKEIKDLKSVKGGDAVSGGGPANSNTSPWWMFWK